jgi:hypothetical protein
VHDTRSLTFAPFSQWKQGLGPLLVVVVLLPGRTESWRCLERPSTPFLLNPFRDPPPPPELQGREKDEGFPIGITEMSGGSFAWSARGEI